VLGFAVILVGTALYNELVRACMPAALPAERPRPDLEVTPAAPPQRPGSTASAWGWRPLALALAAPAGDARSYCAPSAAAARPADQRATSPPCHQPTILVASLTTEVLHANWTTACLRRRRCCLGPAAAAAAARAARRRQCPWGGRRAAAWGGARWRARAASAGRSTRLRAPCACFPPRSRRTGDARTCSTPRQASARWQHGVPGRCVRARRWHAHPVSAGYVHTGWSAPPRSLASPSAALGAGGDESGMAGSYTGMSDGGYSSLPQARPCLQDSVCTARSPVCGGQPPAPKRWQGAAAAQGTGIC